MRWDSQTYWALDLETSGLSPADQILSAGMVPIRQGVICYGEHFYSLVRPQAGLPLSREGIRAHHIVPAELEAAPSLAEVLEAIHLRLSQGVLLLHHAPVDLGFLRRAYGHLRRPWPKPRVLDTVGLIAKLQERQRRLEPYSRPLPTGLAEARAYFGLPPHLEHHALYDALATAELFLLLRSRLGAQTLRQLR
ncbi:PolC-type DNA polymerase III [Calidithermus timidus]|jgi:DNA polymerase-3 subunit epsilon|uniref:3'-5' exonuclease n=1 Tax=Calidithermus timidus TaxID=307124 RepID=UPI000366FC80|nr:3'-5' exonuclease [Calidithermus timidus]